jgi:hypothetical protein
MNSWECTRHLALWSLFHVAGLLELLPSSNVATDFGTEVESCHWKTLTLWETHGAVWLSIWFVERNSVLQGSLLVTFETYESCKHVHVFSLLEFCALLPEECLVPQIMPHHFRGQLLMLHGLQSQFPQIMVCHSQTQFFSTFSSNC